ncbi:MAG: hypothetical protein FVQ81_18650, partial [Candidatus Glassbacteria bacterium]|nr:hypothetical protein [Candidatus Glassbacteria bacterium]
MRRSRIRLPQTMDIFAELLKDHYRIELSDKGRFVTEAIDLWGDLDALAATMADTQQRDLLRCFASANKDECVRVSSSKRGYLSFDDVARILGDDQQAAV